MKNIDKFLIGIGVLSILFGIGGILKGYGLGIFNIFVGIFIMCIVVKDRRKRKKEGE